MKKERKICLPIYKVLYSVFFVIVLAFVRGITDISEIGITLDANIALLVIIFCSDTYEMEYREGRWEIFALMPLKNRVKAIRKRLFIQIFYLSLLSYIGYAFFYWQGPENHYSTAPALLYGTYLVAVTVTNMFWGILVVTLVTMLRHLWAGIGISVAAWLFLNSAAGSRILGRYNIFAYTFRAVTNPADMGWLLGKGIALLLTGIMIAAIPWAIKRRGR